SVEQSGLPIGIALRQDGYDSGHLCLPSIAARLPPRGDRSCQQRSNGCHRDPPALRSPGHAAKGEPPSPSVSELFAVLFARRLVLVLLLAVMSLVPARANPMLLVDM